MAMAVFDCASRLALCMRLFLALPLAWPGCERLACGFNNLILMLFSRFVEQYEFFGGLPFTLYNIFRNK
jgi:hypothetical protein